MIDSHCHVADPVFAPDLEAVLARGREAGLTHVLCILAAGDAAEQAQAERVAAQFTGARFAVGVHPHQAHEAAPAGRAERLVRAACAANTQVRAVGEIGLDYPLRLLATRRAARRCLPSRWRSRASSIFPVIIHTREAEDDTFDILRSEGRGEVRGVFHCFTGDVADGTPRARSRLPAVVRRHPHFSQGREHPRGGGDGARRSPAGGNRQPVSRARSASRQAERTRPRASRHRDAGASSGRPPSRRSTPGSLRISSR